MLSARKWVCLGQPVTSCHWVARVLATEITPQPHGAGQTASSYSRLERAASQPNSSDTALGQITEDAFPASALTRGTSELWPHSCDHPKCGLSALLQQGPHALAAARNPTLALNYLGHSARASTCWSHCILQGHFPPVLHQIEIKLLQCG